MPVHTSAKLFGSCFHALWTEKEDDIARSIEWELGSPPDNYQTDVDKILAMDVWVHRKTTHKMSSPSIT